MLTFQVSLCREHQASQGKKGEWVESEARKDALVDQERQGWLSEKGQQTLLPWRGNRHQLQVSGTDGIIFVEPIPELYTHTLLMINLHGHVDRYLPCCCFLYTQTQTCTPNTDLHGNSLLMEPYTHSLSVSQTHTDTVQTTSMADELSLFNQSLVYIYTFKLSIAPWKFL